MQGDPRSIATSHFLLLYALIRKTQEEGKGRKDSVGKPVRSRAREAPGLMLAAGPTGLLTFYASKADKGIVDKLTIEFMNAQEVRSLGDAAARAQRLLQDVNNLRKDLTEGGKGYSVILAMITAYLGQQRILRTPNTEELYTLIKDMASKPGREAAVQEVLLPYLVHLKQLIESVVKEDE